MNYDNFSSQLQAGAQNYARPNLFEVSLDLASEERFVCKAASLPATTIGVVEVPYQNRKLKVPGDRTYQDWTVTIINDEEMAVRSALLEWQSEMQGFHFFGSDGSTPLDHHRNLIVTALGRDMDELMNDPSEITFFGWPSEIGSVDLSWETTDAVQEYTVTFSITHDNSGRT
jgi:hypothetical protein